MKITKKFLNTFINIENENFYDLAEKLVRLGNEYDEIRPISSATNIVVGLVAEVQNHPESKKLHITKVQISNNEIIQIICGAPNVKKDQKVVVALPGALLLGTIKIGKSVLAGQESAGMICSLKELGIEEKYQKEEDKTGIHVLPSDAPIGKDAIKYLGYDDIIADFDLTADRGDLQSIRGFAYEVGALIKQPVNYPNADFTPIKKDINETHTLQVDTEDCTLYLAKKINNLEIKESSDYIKNRLMSCGIRPINNVIDISNYVMLEFGQPLHFFDADKLGNNIIVRNSKENEEVETLDKNKHKLTESDIVITNKEGIIAVAGVMGSNNTEVDSTTKNIIVEAAIFNPTKVRLASKRIARSESSIRFEKGIDPNITDIALNRACHLLSTLASGEVETGTLIHDKANYNEKKIEITSDTINKLLSLSLSDKEIEEVFHNLNFTTTCFKGTHTVLIPTRRFDISIKEDLVEEVGRVIGYDNIKSKLPTVEIKQGSYSKTASAHKNIRNILSSSGLNQVVTYSLTSTEKSTKFVANNEEYVYLASPLSFDRTCMRQSLINSLIEVYEYNKSRKNENINIYEIGSIYYKNPEFKEEQVVAGLISGQLITNKWQNINIKADFYILKGIAEKILDKLGLNNRYEFSLEEPNKDLHPGISASIYINKELIGHLGKVNPTIQKNDIYVFELNINKILKQTVRKIKVKEISQYPTVSKDLAFTIPVSEQSSSITNILKKVGGRLLTKIEIFDVYTGKNIKEDYKSIAYNLTFGDIKKTLTEEEVKEIFNKMITKVTTELDAELRDK